MAPMNRSFSLPVSLPDRVSRLKVFSGAAGKDEVSGVFLFIRHPSLLAPPLDSSTHVTFAALAYLHPPTCALSQSTTTLPQPIRGSLRAFVTRTRKSVDFSNQKDKEKDQDVADKIEKPDSLGLTIERTLTQDSSTSSTTPTPLLNPTSLPNPPPLTPSYDDQTSHLIIGAMSRKKTDSKSIENKRPSATGAALAAIGLKSSSLGSATPSSRPITPPKPTDPLPTIKTPKPSILLPSKPIGSTPRTEKEERGRQARAPSPFFRARSRRDKARERDQSPHIGALPNDKDAESDGESVVAVGKFRPQASAFDGDEPGVVIQDQDSSDSEDEETPGEVEFDALDDVDIFDEKTMANTKANAFFIPGVAADEDGVEIEGLPPAQDSDNRSVFDNFGEEIEQDLLGEGPNVIVPPPSLFPVHQAATAKRQKSLKSGMELVTGLPAFARDRCTMTLTQGDPDGALEKSGKRLRRYVVLSDLSDESRYALEWAIGTVARDGDELFVISVKEDESKVDPKSWNNADRVQKLRVQKERQGGVQILVRQVNSLLSRTRLQITVTCQYLHAKNARHMLLDLVDFLEPTMVIVGSRGLGEIKGILLGSTSHYLVQKSSVPVMVARRRLLRPLRKTNPANLRHSPRVSLASASIEKAASSKQEDEIVDVAKEEGAEEGPVSEVSRAMESRESL
ncbi:hypothetical protein TREMEDRAFT_69603 [Tremella mesenterica DSM 1558]|uniref:uncharacterized protein n=1 Tax=Tremella mesenterica (strain ATCC 24925 / CBS 8224 / DSM 1558 / NBRC 9311 / NRRL Y-6157 / RJB 2259-6 / UBC 559-6) TaxID=578456 RepID=UPI0003F499FD|nr:uncharacterized protein TREMEDRAFT_69603 [Tremella mesenterica DSM 1558]EIW67476.1 hypothetical protein TREMEDRAFT_69603 [Tremella mesenterica DSM 1558]